ncbi:MAG: succinate dehydrogenase, hydrophobic membrane anchor protein [Alphaproteobacteria bacterium]|jgi:succinate dehydrogenase / fumarate reductase membrane anchor subunit|nr:succinate dehydrogenase, hydrophobic membrane anchor protein [Alphaproteobacteria bacterium]|tara:strand:+ start:586 stop:966 length:381 start_codon:yes stop_codon:yes gene_type:complete
MNMRTQLGEVRGLGSAKTGTSHFWMQRLTALALIPLTLWFVASLASMGSADYADAVAWVKSPLTSILLLALIAATFHHMQLGLQVIIEDYVHAEGLKIASLIVMKCGSVLLGLAAAFAVLKVAFEG